MYTYTIMSGVVYIFSHVSEQNVSHTITAMTRIIYFRGCMWLSKATKEIDPTPTRPAPG